MKWDHRLTNASSGVSITVVLCVGLKVHFYLIALLFMLSNTVLASQHQPPSAPALVESLGRNLSRAACHGLAGYWYCHASAQYLVSSKPLKMSKSTLNFALFWSITFFKVNSSLRENNSEHKNEAEHLTSILPNGWSFTLWSYNLIKTCFNYHIS